MAITINGSGTISGLSVGGLPDGSVDADTLAADSVTAAKLKSDAITATDLPSGSVLQVKTVQVTSTSSVTLSTGGTEMTAFNLNITPTSTSSKIYVVCNLFLEAGGSIDDHDMTFWFKRGSTDLRAPSAGSRRRAVSMIQIGYFGDDNASTPSTLHMEYIDSPNSTSEQTYKILAQSNGSGTVYINRSASDTDTSGYERGVSTFTLMEIAG